MITKEQILNINKSFIYITNEPFGASSNLDFAIEEFQDSRKTKQDIATLVYRIISTHPFIQGNKRTASAVMELHYNINIEESKEVLKYVAAHIHKIEKEEAVERIIKIMR